jgi:sugar/nucleoside kinase (ribokinase family)
MVHALLLGQGPAQALATACALAAISTTGLGGRTALPTREALEAFLAAKTP